MKKHDFPQINISPAFFIIVALSSLTDISGIFSMVILSVLAHETSHVLAMKLLKIDIKRMDIRGFGIEIYAKLPQGVRAAAVMFAGPAGNLLLAVLLIPASVFGSIFADNLACCSLLLGIFHLLPMYGLDGGNAIIHLFDGRCNQNRVVITVKVIAITASIVMFMAAVFAFIDGKINVSLIVLSIYFLLNAVSDSTGRIDLKRSLV